MNVTDFNKYLIEYFFLQKKIDNGRVNQIELKLLVKYFFKLLVFYSNKKIYVNRNIISIFNKILRKKKNFEPTGYITGEKSFYYKKILVNKNVLVPRSDSEFLIDIILFYVKKDNIKLLDLGTGSCAISMILKLKKTKWDLYSSDISEHSLNLAKHNSSKQLKNKMDFFLGSWLSPLPKTFIGKIDVIISNPPYISAKDLKKNMKILKYEPFISLYAKKNGYNSFIDIIFQAKKYLKKRGFIVLEHGLYQGKTIRSILFKNQYVNIRTIKDLNKRGRVTIAVKQ